MTLAGTSMALLSVAYDRVMRGLEGYEGVRG